MYEGALQRWGEGISGWAEGAEGWRLEPSSKSDHRDKKQRTPEERWVGGGGRAAVRYERSEAQRVLRFKSQQRGGGRLSGRADARIQLPSVAYLLSCQKTRRCPSRAAAVVSVAPTARPLALLRSNASLRPPLPLSLYMCTRMSLFPPFSLRSSTSLSPP